MKFKIVMVLNVQCKYIPYCFEINTTKYHQFLFSWENFSNKSDAQLYVDLVNRDFIECAYHWYYCRFCGILFLIRPKTEY